MKKCSTSVHHTLTELNITPLLDLAFVLLVPIFLMAAAMLAGWRKVSQKRRAQQGDDGFKGAS